MHPFEEEFSTPANTCIFFSKSGLEALWYPHHAPSLQPTLNSPVVFPMLEERWKEFMYLVLKRIYQVKHLDEQHGINGLSRHIEEQHILSLDVGSQPCLQSLLYQSLSPMNCVNFILTEYILWEAHCYLLLQLLPLFHNVIISYNLGAKWNSL